MKTLESKLPFFNNSNFRYVRIEALRASKRFEETLSIDVERLILSDGLSLNDMGEEVRKEVRNEVWDKREELL